MKLLFSLAWMAIPCDSRMVPIFYQCFAISVIGMLVASPARAWTYHTPESSATSDVARLFERYVEKHGHLPSNWDEVNSAIDEGVGFVRGDVGSLAKRYAFVSPPLTVERPRFGEILIIGRKPVSEMTKRRGSLGMGL